MHHAHLARAGLVMMSQKIILLLVVAGFLLPAAPVRADESEPARLLTERGLRRVASYWVLPGEKQLQDGLAGLEPRKRELAQALKLRGDYEKDRNRKRAAVLAAVAEHRRLSMLMLEAEDRDDALEVVARMNALAAQIDQMTVYLNDPDVDQQITRRIGQAGDALHAELVALRELADQTVKRYEELAADTAVQAAIAALAEESGRSIRLGPRGIFARNLAELERYEAAVRTEKISLREDNGVFWVETVLNGSTRVEMVFDTGASLISLPAEAARRAGITLTDADPVVRTRVADGRTVEGRLVFLDEVRVGPFTVKNVEAIVNPEELQEAPPLLGGSFLRNFSIDLNHAAGELTLTEIGDLDAKPPKR